MMTVPCSICLLALLASIVAHSVFWATALPRSAVLKWACANLESVPVLTFVSTHADSNNVVVLT